MGIASVLDSEIRRVAKAEDISIREVVEDVAGILGYKDTRQIYNFRTGKWPLPAAAIPLLCHRFKSRALLHALIAECEREPVEVPDQFELGRLTTTAVRDVMSHYTELLNAFDSDGGIDRRELSSLRTSTERVCETLWAFYEIAAADYERRREVEK